MKIKQKWGLLLAALALGAGLFTATSTQAASKPVVKTVGDTVIANGKTYSLAKAAKLGLIEDPTGKITANKYAYQFKQVKAKRTKSGKKVTVTGRLRISNYDLAFNRANRVQILTPHGMTYAKVTKKLTFKKTVKTKAKKVHLRAGHYGKLQGHKGNVLQVLSAKKAVKVAAYK